MKYLLAIVSMFLFSGCVFHYPDDLKLYSVDVKQEFDYIIHHKVSIPRINERIQADGGFLSVKFTSSHDLLREKKSKSSSVTMKAYFCDVPEKAVFLSLPDVFYGKYSLVYRHFANEKELDKNLQTDKFIYSAILYLKDESKRKVNFTTDNQKYFLQYNLISQPEDICFFLLGGNMVINFKSNVVRITKDELQSIMMRQK